VAVVQDRDAVPERAALVEDDRLVVASELWTRVLREERAALEFDRLVALDPTRGADREPDHREPEGGQDQGAWATGPQEGDRPVAALDARGYAQVGRVLLRRSQPLLEV
jgi:hypothetical protein